MTNSDLMHNKIEPDFYFAISLFLAIIFHFVLPVTKIIYFPYSLSGLVLIIAGILLISSTNQILIRNKTTFKTFNTPSMLITSGLFSISRNPLYLGMTIMLFGIASILGSLSPFTFPILFFIIIDRSVIPFEEKNLESSFGNEYLAYKRRVRRWL